MENPDYFTLNNLMDDFDKLKQNYNAAINKYFDHEELCCAYDLFMHFATAAESIFNDAYSLMVRLKKVPASDGHALILSAQFIGNDIKCKFHSVLNMILSEGGYLSESEQETIDIMNVYRTNYL